MITLANLKARDSGHTESSVVWPTMSIPTITCGVSQMPVVGFGTSRTKDPRGEVEMALSAGYRHVDCAYVSLTISCQSLFHCVTPWRFVKVI